MANGGEEVKLDDGQLFLGAGAEPLSQSRLQTGHLIDDRPSGIYKDLKEEIFEDQSVMRTEDYRQITDVKG